MNAFDPIIDSLLNRIQLKFKLESNVLYKKKKIIGNQNLYKDSMKVSVKKRIKLYEFWIVGIFF